MPMSTKINNVEKQYILQTVMEGRQTLHVNKPKLEAEVWLVKIESELLCLELPEDNPGAFAQWDKVSVMFDFRGTVVTFKTVVKKYEGRKIFIANPGEMYRGLARRYLRISPPKDLAVSFLAQDDEYNLDYPLCEEYCAVEVPMLSDTFDITSLAGLLTSFRERARSVASENGIVMFRNRKPESFEERMIAATGKILYLPSTRTGLPHVDPYPEGRLITRKLEEEFESNEPEAFDGGLARILKEKTKQGIHAEIYCPILYYQYVVGYVYLANRDSHSVSFDMFSVDFAFDFSRILAYSLKTSGYFRSCAGDGEPKAREAELIDVSVGGMLFAAPDKRKLPPFKMKSVIIVKLRFGGREIRVKSRVVRCLKDGDGVFYGVFFDFPDGDDLHDFYSYLYGKPYENSEAKWEGAVAEASGGFGGV
jgi:hypothetical protein